MRTLIAIFATLSCLSAPVVAQVAAAPQFISLYPDADPTYTEGIVIPAGSPVQLVAFPRDWGSTAEFRGQFTLTGTYEIEEVQPSGITDGLEQAGPTATPAQLADSIFRNIGLARDQDLVGFNFAELEALSKRRFLASTGT